MQTNPKCSPVEDQAEIQECSENETTIVVHDGNLGVEMPEVSYTSSAMAHFSNGTWTEFSVTNQPDGELSFDYETSLSLANGITPSSSQTFVGTTNCGSPNYFKTFSWKAPQPYEWWYREANKPDSHAFYRILDAFKTWKSGANRCNDTIISNSYSESYMGITTLAIPYQDNPFYPQTFGDCLNPGSKDMFAWSWMPSTEVAVTCTYHSQWDIFNVTPARSSVILTSTQNKFYTDPSPSGCTNNLYDLQAIATHEIGHTLGLDHFTHIGQSMNPSIGPCATDKRGLGYGDVHGVASLFPPN